MSDWCKSSLVLTSLEPEVLIPAHGMAKLNRSRDSRSKYVLVPEEDGDGYFGGLEVFHQLHCLVGIPSFLRYLPIR